MRRLSLILGIAVLGAAWISPLPSLARQAFFAHMTMHMAVVAIAAPLIALGIASTRLDPVPRSPSFFAPLPTSLLELVLVWTWHVPLFHHAARSSWIAMAAEQATFLIAGLLLWLSAFGGVLGSGRAAAGVAGLLLTSMHMTLLGGLFALTSRPLYTHGHVLRNLTPIADQHLGGAIMLLVGGVSYLAGGLFLTAGLLRERRT